MQALTERVTLDLIVIKESQHRQGYGSLFLNQCERWLRHQSKQYVQVRYSPGHDEFFDENGYYFIGGVAKNSL